jgi:hypothetical protein
LGGPLIRVLWNGLVVDYFGSFRYGKGNHSGGNGFLCVQFVVVKGYHLLILVRWLFLNFRRCRVGTKIHPISSTLNPKAGTSPVFTFEFPDGFILIKDTREQSNHFSRPPKNLIMTRATLKVGDYSIKGFENEISIEYKDLPNLFSSMFANWESEEKGKCERLSKLSRKWLLIGASEEEVLSYPQIGRTHPNQMRWRLAGSIEVRLGIPVHYETNRERRERWILDRLLFFFKLKRGLVHP